MTKPRRTARLVWHYTHADAFQKIMASGVIACTDPIFLGIGEQPVAWFTTNQFWEETVRKVYKADNSPLGMTQMLEAGIDLYRIGVEPGSAPLTWDEIVEQAHIARKAAHAMRSVGKRWGAKPSEWRGSLTPVPRERWLAVQTYDRSKRAWVRCDSFNAQDTQEIAEEAQQRRSASHDAALANTKRDAA